MKTASLSYPSHTLRFIDTAPLAARYEVLCASMMMFIEARQMARALRLSHKIVRLVRTFTRLDRHNILLRRKLDMLIDTAWRGWVLKELGGVRKLKLWEAAKARLDARRENPPRPERLSISEQTPAWLLTPERIAESERLKAHVRLCGRVTASPNVFRDRIKMDFDGMFRLAPLPRGPRGTRQVKVYTQNSIVDYDWNNIPFAKETGLGPASVWPAEFYAAMEAEAEVLGTEDISSRNLPCTPLEKGVQPPRPGNWVPNQVWDERSFKNIPLLPLTQTLSPKVHRDLFGSLTR